jgi:hypothetical protein
MDPGQWIMDHFSNNLPKNKDGLTLHFPRRLTSSLIRPMCVLITGSTWRTEGKIYTPQVCCGIHHHRSYAFHRPCSISYTDMTECQCNIIFSSMFYDNKLGGNTQQVNMQRSFQFLWKCLSLTLLSRSTVNPEIWPRLLFQTTLPVTYTSSRIRTDPLPYLVHVPFFLHPLLKSKVTFVRPSSWSKAVWINGESWKEEHNIQILVGILKINQPPNFYIIYFSVETTT